MEAPTAVPMVAVLLRPGVVVLGCAEGREVAVGETDSDLLVMMVVDTLEDARVDRDVPVVSIGAAVAEG